MNIADEILSYELENFVDRVEILFSCCKTQVFIYEHVIMCAENNTKFDKKLLFLLIEPIYHDKIIL